jgi:hypothetical protein
VEISEGGGSEERGFAIAICSDLDVIVSFLYHKEASCNYQFFHRVSFDGDNNMKDDFQLAMNNPKLLFIFFMQKRG